ncbi:thiamine phosphate synthase [Membranihabitans maritimus]|uniref:thiamine phosphate synthase n=1 Tax=Membranihabitans maritimus TaxID=2904244 RepID=UPI001F2868A8|nr:thiamine phosphate synthase [Membranihabitans maritimus]
MTKKKKFLKGLYLVVDPSLPRKELFEKVRIALSNGVAILQIWDHWTLFDDEEDIYDFITQLLSITSQFDCIVIINNRWEWLQEFSFEGVHFDQFPENLEEIRDEIGEERIIGITCGNNKVCVEKAGETNVDYISFCSIFPSSSAGDCEIIDSGTVHYAAKQLRIPIFISGGINSDNLLTLSDWKFDGVAVISGILNSENIENSIKEYQKSFEKLGM